MHQHVQRGDEKKENSMNGCGIACVLFIWIIFLWPIIVSILFILIKKINNKGKYFLISVSVGYIILIFCNILIIFLSRKFLNIDELVKLVKNGTDLELLNNILGWTTSIILFLPPILFSYYLSKKYQKTSTPQTNKSNQETKQ